MSERGHPNYCWLVKWYHKGLITLYSWFDSKASASKCCVKHSTFGYMKHLEWCRLLLHFYVSEVAPIPRLTISGIVLWSSIGKPLGFIKSPIVVCQVKSHPDIKHVIGLWSACSVSNKSKKNISLAAARNYTQCSLRGLEKKAIVYRGWNLLPKRIVAGIPHRYSSEKRAVPILIKVDDGLKPSNISNPFNLINSYCKYSNTAYPSWHDCLRVGSLF